LLVVSSDRVGAEMAGPAIRAFEIANAMSADCDVTLAAPRGSTLPDGSEFEFAELAGGGSIEELARRHDVLLAQFLPGSVLAKLIGSPTRLVFDMYDPRPLEVLERHGDLAPTALDRQVVAEATDQLAYLAAADFAVCASERQRDLWVGALMGAGLVDPDHYRADPGYRSFIDVVPFGIPDQPPQHTERVLKGVWPGVSEHDRVIVWGGGVWDWLDPLCAVEAVELAVERIEGLKLFFLGTGRPPHGDEEEFPPMTASAELERRLADGNLEDRLVFMNRNWVPYRARANYLLEADLGVSTHLDHLEARYAYRTRVLDYLWAGLPVIATEGDVLADLVETESLGGTAPPADPQALADAIVALLGDPGRLESAKARIAELAPRLRWSQVVEPLRRFVAAPPEPRSPQARRRAQQLVRQARRTRRRLILRQEGPGGVTRAARRKLR
jgi:glycosyltransferase involved in cell wall biosynthesis